MDRAVLRDNLAQSVVSAVTKYALFELKNADDGEVISDKEAQLLAERLVARLSIDNRIKLYMDVFLTEVGALAIKTGEDAVADKVKKAFRGQR